MMREVETIYNVDQQEEYCSIEDIEETNITEMRELYEDLLQTYINKNKDYGNSFDQSLAEFGLVASAVRMTDKLNRLKTLINKPQSQVDESLCDTLLDLANYAVMTARYIKEVDE